MAHREARDALRERRERVVSRLAAIEVSDAHEERISLLLELEELRASLELITPPRPVLRHLPVVRGCDMPWSNMMGDARVRHCGACDREVYDLKAMDPDEVEAFVEARKENLPSMRMHVRPDGRYQDGPCATGERRELKRGLLAALALGLVGIISMLAADSSAEATPVRPPHRVRYVSTHYVEPKSNLAALWSPPSGHFSSCFYPSPRPAFTEMLIALEASIWASPAVTRAAREAGRGSVTLAVTVHMGGQVTAVAEAVSRGFDDVAALAIAVANRVVLERRPLGPVTRQFSHDFE